MTTTSPIGGVETWLDRICPYLAAQGFDPVVALMRGLAFNRPEKFVEYHTGLNCVEVDGSGMNREGRVRALIRCLRQTRPSVCLPMSVYDAVEASARYRSEDEQFRLMAHAQGNLPAMLADLCDYRGVFDSVVCPGRLTRMFLVEHGQFEPDRVVECGNGADEPVVDHVPPRKDGPLRIGYVGRFTHADKRIRDLPEIARRVAELGIPVEWTLAGDGPERPAVLDQLRQQGALLRELGAVPRDDLYQTVYPNLDCLLLMSQSETYGIALAEAMMHGVVPVTSQYHGFWSQRLVVDNVHGLSFPIGDCDAAAQQIARLHHDPSLLDELGRQGRDHARLNCSWDACLEGWSGALRRTLASPRVAGQASVVRPPEVRQGRLERIGVSPAVVDSLRRLRRTVFGAAVQPGGEEWPLYGKHHAPQRLESITRALESLEIREQPLEAVRS